MEVTTAKKETSWPAVGTFGFVHSLGLVGAPLYAYFFMDASEVVTMLLVATIYFFLAHFSIAFVHRGFTHDAFVMSPVVAFITMLFFSATGEGPAWWWRGKHIDHHNNSDVPGKDPHTPRDGFFHSHMGWLMTKEGISPPSMRSAFYNKKSVTGKALEWQRKWYWPLVIFMSIIFPTLLGGMLGDLLGGLLIIGLARQVLQWHMTWVVNSIGHTFGRKTSRGATNFSNWPLGIPFFGILTVGESEHGHHHEQALEWKLGTKWYHFDLSAWLIQLLIWTGLASHRQQS